MDELRELVVEPLRRRVDELEQQIAALTDAVQRYEMRLEAVEAMQANLPMRMALAVRDLQPDVPAAQPQTEPVCPLCRKALDYEYRAAWVFSCPRSNCDFIDLRIYGEDVSEALTLFARITGQAGAR